MIKVGNTVQYRAHEKSKWAAAIVTSVSDVDWVGLAVFFPDGATRHLGSVERGELPGNCWREIPDDAPATYSWFGGG
jgi:hypothetical protein